MSHFTISSLHFLLLLLFLYFSITSSSSASRAPQYQYSLPSAGHDHLIRVACNWTWFEPGNEPPPQYNSCIALLGSLPGSRAATLPGLAVIITRHAIGRMRTAMKYAQKLLSAEGSSAGGGERRTKECLEECVRYYHGDIAIMRDSAVRELEEGRYEDAAVLLSAILDDIDGGCNVGFHDANVGNPLLEMNQELLGVITVAVYIGYNISKKFP